MEKSKLEFKVGAFVMGGLIILTIFIFKISDLKNYGSGYPIKFIFSNISGVKAGSPVRLSGLGIGEVRQVNIIKSTGMQIEIVALIKKSYSIPLGSSAFVSTLGLLGEKFIEIIPPDQYNTFLKAGDSIRGVDPVVMQHWIDESEQILEDVKEIISKVSIGDGTVGKLLNEDELYTELIALIRDIRDAKQGTIGKLLYDDKIYQELEALVSDLRRHPWKLFWKTR